MYTARVSRWSEVDQVTTLPGIYAVICVSRKQLYIGATGCLRSRAMNYRREFQDGQFDDYLFKVIRTGENMTRREIFDMERRAIENAQAAFPELVLMNTCHARAWTRLPRKVTP